MASTYTTNNGIEKIGSGDQAGTWGNTTNANFDIIDKAINGVEAITLSSTSKTITTTDGSAASEGVNRVFVFSGSPGGTCTVTIAPNDAEKVYLIKNGTDQTVLITQGSGANASLASGETSWVFTDGAGSGAVATKQDISSAPATFSVGTDLTVGDDLSLISDGAILNFGVNSDVNITHIHDTGLLINAARELRFRDADLKILSSADGQLDIDADTELELTAPTVQLNVTTADLNGNLDVSGTSTLTGNVTLGGQLIMPDVTTTKILVADGTSYQEVAVSGDVTIANTGAVTIAADAVETAMIGDGQITTAKLAGSVAVVGMSIKLAGATFGNTASVNVSGVTDNGVGDYTITIDTDFANANYAAQVTTFDDDGTNRNLGEVTVHAQAAGTIQIKSHRPSSSENSARAAFDPDGLFVTCSAQ
jgi:hypothetical protein